MADEEYIRVEGLDRLLKKIGKLGPGVYKPAIAEGATHLRDVIREYPPRRFGEQPFKTLRQRRYFFYALEAGLIQVPYVRGLSPGSERLGARWTIVFKDQGKTAVVGNNARYAAIVHSQDEQSHYHTLTGWKTDRRVAQDEAGEVRKIVARHYWDAIRKD